MAKKTRVSELAKEFGITSNEMLEIIKGMGIPVKNHASTLESAYVDKIRKKVGPELQARAEELEKARLEEAARIREAEERAREEEEAKLRAAREAEMSAREAERIKQAQEEAEALAAAKKAEEAAAAPEPEPAPAPVAEPAPAPIVEPAPAVELVSEPVVEEAAPAVEPEDTKVVEEKKVLRVEKSSRLTGLLSNIEAESKRLEQEEAEEEIPAPAVESSIEIAIEAPAEQKSAPQPAPSEAPAEGKAKTKKKGKGAAKSDESSEAPSKKKGKGKGKADKYVDRFEDEDGGEEDRYSKMAAAAEKMQHQRVLDEARAMVDAASKVEGEGRRKKRKEKREAQAKAKAEEQALERGLDPSLVLDDSVVQITTGSTVAEVADALGVQSSEIIKKLFLLGTPLTVTQLMSDELIDLIADDLGRKVRIVSPEEEYAVVINDTEDDLKPRPPVVTVMGHVDHGKTSLLDAIRNTGVQATEAGGITQAIGASVVDINGNQITFIDTPGHEAFTAMRARGAAVTDVVVLVVAADDGVMPQTIEAISHANAAGVPIVVAVNKIDKDGANVERVKNELSQYGIIPEEWGGQNMFVEVSAKKNININELLETIILQADVLELKANPDALASGIVIEANLDKGMGPVATVLIQRGTLKVGDTLVAGTAYGRVRALIDPKGNHVDKALPSDPVEVLGLSSVPSAGDEFRVFEDERDARNLAEDRALRIRLKEQQSKAPVTLDDFFSRIEEGKLAELNLVLKADTQGSIEALRDAFEKMDQSEVRINIIHSAVGGITETDVILAAASDAIIIGFGVRPQTKAKQMAEKEKVEIRTYRVIYKAIEEINAARVGLLQPDIIEVETATIQVRELFKVPKVGIIAGCFVEQGEVSRNDKIRIVRNGTIIHEGTISSLRRFKDDVASVRQNYECGIGIEGFQDIHIDDVIESYQLKEVAREA